MESKVGDARAEDAPAEDARAEDKVASSTRPGKSRSKSRAPSTSSAMLHASDATKQRLGELVGKFDSFESEMLEGTRQRREKDEHVVVELKEDMAQLERVLETEMTQRVEMNKSLQQWCGEQVEVVRQELLDKVEGKMGVLQSNIDVLSDRVELLEAALQREKESIPADIERRGAELTERLTAFQQLFDTERVARLEREKEITLKIAAHENHVSEELDAERSVREKRYQALRAVLEESVTLRKSRTERFHVTLEQEVAKLKNSIQAESVLREKEDDEIVETLSRYTAKLQDSLRVINITDV